VTEPISGDDEELTGGLTVLVADEDTEALRSTARVLGELGHTVTAYAVSVRQAAVRIAEEDPDVSVVAVHDDPEHALDLIDELSAAARGPVVAVVEGGGGDFLARAAARGIDSFARSEDHGEMQGAIEVALRRHRQEADLAARVDQLETALERRALIERAKGILMERHSLDDQAAFEMLRSHARSHSRPVVQVAGAVVDGLALLPARNGSRAAGT
jgi:response regulator NasT